jgi:23S rRNA (uracil1939-C5)-methyltransferase
VELYAGAGNLTIALARVLGDLVAVESSRAACDAARKNLAVRGLAARVVEADAASHAWSPATRVLVLDPPRTGARDVAARLAASRVRRVVYVSCDPQTLGRDLALLAPAYALASVDVFEMFPQTSHVETVVALDRS